jgi:ABC-type phosphate transport system substrate-binding protein
MKKIRMVVAGALLFAGVQSASSASGELAIIVNANNQVSEITAEQVASIFLGKSRRLPDGTKVIPIDQFEGEKPRAEFYSKIVQKSQSQLNSYWSRLIFTGKGQPPFAVTGDSEVLEFIASNPNMIGYVDLATVESLAGVSDIKVLLTVR